MFYQAKAKDFISIFRSKRDLGYTNYFKKIWNAQKQIHKYSDAFRSYPETPAPSAE